MHELLPVIIKANNDQVCHIISLSLSLFLPGMYCPRSLFNIFLNFILKRVGLHVFFFVNSDYEALFKFVITMINSILTFPHGSGHRTLYDSNEIS